MQAADRYVMPSSMPSGRPSHRGGRRSAPYDAADVLTAGGDRDDAPGRAYSRVERFGADFGFRPKRPQRGNTTAVDFDQ
jgi:hypothetical protein